MSDPIRDDARPSVDPRRIRRWALGFLAVGVVLRVVRFLLRYPLWHDEAFVAANFIDRGYGDLLGPLEYLQVCPILFLWVELTVVKLFGFSEWSLRLFPTACAVGGLWLFDRLARRTLPGWSYPLAVGIMAVSYSPIRHGNEVKPYATDLLAATALLLLAVRWREEPGRSRRLWQLAAVSPIALAGSLTAVFVVAGIGMTLAPVVWEARRRGVWAAYLAFGASSAAMFVLLLRCHLATAQSEWLRVAYLLPYWSGSFPPLGDGAIATLGWLVRIHSGNLLAYPVGAEDGGSVATLACVVVGVVALMRSGRTGIALLLLMPFVLNLAAAAIGRYPYGGEARIAQHLAPSACLLAGLGAARMVDRARTEARAERLRRLAMGGLILIGGVLLIHSLVSPYHMDSSARDREFARWFWAEQSRGADVACLKADLGLDFEPRQWITGISASYLCNRAIYAPHRPSGSSDARPRRFVLFHVDSYPSPLESPGFRAWMDAMTARLGPGRVASYVVNADRGLVDWKVGRYWVVDFPTGERVRSEPSPGLAGGLPIGEERAGPQVRR